MGKSRNQLSIRSLDEMVSKESPARQIDSIVDGLDTSYFAKAEVKETGRPPYKPKDLLKLLVYGMDNGVTSTRKLERESKCNIEAMWLLNELRPDSTTIRNFRRENAANLIRFFNEFCRKLAEQGYIDGKIVAIDGTKIRANNSRRNNYSLKKLDRHIDYIDRKITEYMQELDKNDKLEELQERKAKYKEFRERISNGEVTEVSATDSDSRLMRQGNGGADVSYNVQAAVDSKHKLIAGVMVTNEPNDQGQLSKAAKAVKDNLGLKTMTVPADKGYYSTEDFKACHADGITTLVSRPKEREAAKELFRKEDFRYDKENDCYYCPAGQILKFSTEDKGYKRYRNVKACKSCNFKQYCTKGNRRDLCRHIHEEHAEQNDRDFAKNQETYKLRQQLSEHPFGTVKRTMGIRQFLSRGLVNVNAEAALIFLAYNLKRLRNIQMNNPNNTRDYPLCCQILAQFVFFLLLLLFLRKSKLCSKINPVFPQSDARLQENCI